MCLKRKIKEVLNIKKNALIKYLTSSFLIIMICIAGITFTMLYAKNNSNETEEKQKITHTDVENNLSEKELENGRKIALEISKDTINTTPISDQNKTYFGEFEIGCFTGKDILMDNGEHPYEGCAASYDFPIGTILDIVGVGEFTVTDSNTIPGVIKIYLSSEESCTKFGGKDTDVYVINK